MTRISKTSLRVLLAPVLASALACSDDSGTPSQGDSGADLSGPDARGGDLVVDGSATEDSRAPSDASDLMDIVIANVCPPSAVKELTPYALKIQYHTWCLGAYPAASCHVQVDGDRIKLTLSVQDHAHSIGCDSSGSEYHDVTCELPALPAGSYTVEDASCPSCFTAPLQVAGATEGEPTCVTISSSS